MQYFEFVTKTILKTHCNILPFAKQCLHSIRTFSVSHSAPPVNRLGVCNRPCENMAGTVDPRWPNWYPIPDDIVLSNKIRRKGGRFGVMAFVFPSNYYTWWSPAFTEIIKHLPANQIEWKKCLPYFACASSFCFTY